MSNDHPAEKAYDETLDECARVLDEQEMVAARIATYKMMERWKLVDRLREETAP